MAPKIRSRILRSAVVLGFLCLNLAIAAPASAGLKSVPCIDPETGGVSECCEFCLIIGCDCSRPT